MSQAEVGAVSVPDPELIRARIDQLDREADFLRKLLRLLVRFAAQSAPRESCPPAPQVGPQLYEVPHGE